MSIRKTFCILLAVLFLVSMTAAAASAWNSKKATAESVLSSEDEGAKIKPSMTVNCDETGCIVTSTIAGCLSGDADIGDYLNPDVSKKLKETYGVA